MQPEELVLRAIEARSRRRLAGLAREFVGAASKEREMIYAAMEFERWLAESCHESAKPSARQYRS